MKKTVALILVLTLLLQAVSFAAAQGGIGDFKTTDLDGNPFTEDWFSENDVKLVLLNLWEPWCGPCVGEMPELEKLYKKYRDKGLVIIGAFSYEDDDAAREVVKDAGITYPIVHYCSEFDRYASQYVPTSAFLAPDGTVYEDQIIGSLSYSEWERLIKKYLPASDEKKGPTPTPVATSAPVVQSPKTLQFRQPQVVAAGDFFAVGIASDGTCVSAGTDIPKVSGWKNMVALSATDSNIAGLKQDGTVVCDDRGLNNAVSGWTDIIQIGYGAQVLDGTAQHIVGLTAGGKVFAAGSNEYGQCNTFNWTDIIDVAAGYAHTVGLKADGTVVACGENGSGQCNVSGWTGIVDVAAARYATYGLTSDGKILVAGTAEEPPAWQNVVAIIAQDETGAASDFVIGICSDGSIVSDRWGYLEDGEIESFSDVVSVAASSWGYTICSDSQGNVRAVGWDVDGARKVDTWPKLLAD